MKQEAIDQQGFFTNGHKPVDALELVSDQNLPIDPKISQLLAEIKLTPTSSTRIKVGENRWVGSNW